MLSYTGWLADHTEPATGPVDSQPHQSGRRDSRAAPTSTAPLACARATSTSSPGQAAHPAPGTPRRKYEHCTFPGCARQHQSGGLCTGHATQRQRGQPLRRLGGEGRWIDPKGYVWIRCPVRDHPNAKAKGGWIAEHVWVTSQALGRPLRRGESVHQRTTSSMTTVPRTWSSGTPTSRGAPASRTRSAGPAGSSRSTGRSSRRRPQGSDAASGEEMTRRTLEVTNRFARLGATPV
jgi:hypothetical protein